jgi:probable F420-dependent oxidoreductase
MREYIAALHAIWDAFEQGGKLDFQGDVYQHSLLSFEFIPYVKGYGRPPITLAGVGPRMIEVAVDLTDGLVMHPFASEKSIRTITLPIVDERLAKNSRSRSDFDLILPLMIATGSSREELARNIERCRHRIGFYSSTLAYRSVLEVHGWLDLHDETKKLTREGRWDELGAPITDEILNTFAITGEPDGIAKTIKQRFGGVVDAIRSDLELEDQETQHEIIRAIEAI